MNYLSRKQIYRKSRGAYTIIASIFLVLVVLFISSSIFIRITNKNSLYYQEIGAQAQEDSEKIQETLFTSHVIYFVEYDKVLLSCSVRNDCSYVIQILNLWIHDTTIKKHGYNKTININLKPGETIVFNGSSALSVTIEGSDLSHNFMSWFVTARGNIIPVVEEIEISYSVVSQGIGYLALSFHDFRYYTYQTMKKLDNYPEGTISFEIPRNTYVAFSCTLTNMDLFKRPITLDSHSLFWQPGRSGVSESGWFIVNVLPNGVIKETYSEITLEFDQPVSLIFASGKDLAVENFFRERSPNPSPNAVASTFILLHGTIGSTDFAQTIPFVTLYYADA